MSTDDPPLLRWLLPRDPRRLALAWLAATLLCLVAGGALALLMRAELVTPDADFVSAATYNRAFTLHGALMAIVFALPAIAAALGHVAVPHMLGWTGRVPRLGAVGLHLFVASALLLIAGSSAADATEFSTPAWLGLLGLGLAACVTALHHGVTVLRRPGAGPLPMFVWAVLGGGAAVLATAVTLAALAAAGRTTASELMALGGGSVSAIATVFAYGVVCEIFADHPHGLAARRVIGAALALLVIASLPVWSMAPEAAGVALDTRRIATTTLFCAWMVSAIRGGYARATPRLFAAAIVATLPVLGAVNAVIAMFDADVHLHDTYFLVGRFHLEMDVVLLAFLGGLHLWWPRLTGRAESGRAGWLGPALLWAGMMLTALAQLALGHEGMPRRYYAYLPEFEGLHRAATVGAGLQALALVWIAVRLARTPAASDMSPRT